MPSYFPFAPQPQSAASVHSPLLDDPHLELTITPSASAFYAGEAFSVTITFRNTRTPHTDVLKVPPSTDSTSSLAAAVPQNQHFSSTDSRRSLSIPRLPRRLNQIGPDLPETPLVRTKRHESAESNPSRTSSSVVSTPRFASEDPGHPYSPGANPADRARGWLRSPSPQREGPMNYRSPDGWGSKESASTEKSSSHARRTRSLALGKGTMSPQELVWALGGGKSTPSALPTRRPQGGIQIPANHPHSRKISITNVLALERSGESSRDSPEDSSPSLISIPERPSSIAKNGDASSSQSRRPASPISKKDDAGTTEVYETRSSPRIRPSHSRVPSYQNAYGASYMGYSNDDIPTLPSHSNLREYTPAEPKGTTTVLWAYTRLVGRFHPSTAYIPPDPLLPLRAALLHQPVGSGSLFTPSQGSSANVAGRPSGPSRWQLSFGTGTIGNSTQPSLTGSLFGLAKDLVMGGGGGSLEEERKRVWNLKDLPVLETTRSLLAVDMKLKEGEVKQFTYTLQLPTNLPPAHRGRAFRFSYDLVVSLSVALPGGGDRQKSKDVVVPIRIWANVSLRNPLRTYDVLKPIIQNKEEGRVEDVGNSVDLQSPYVREGRTKIPAQRRQANMPDQLRIKTGDTSESLRAYALHLLDILNDDEINTLPLSPNMPKSLHRLSTSSPSSPAFHIPILPTVTADSFIEGDNVFSDELGGSEGCGEAVEILSRHSAKASYDIEKNGESVAILTLVKTTYRLGESVLGIVTFNKPQTFFPVLKFSAYLLSQELIPEPLLPPSLHSGGSTQPSLYRLHAEHHTLYALSAQRLAFSLDIPSDATPAFNLVAGEGEKGGLQWKLKLNFTVGVPPREWKRKTNASNPKSENDVDAKGTMRSAGVHLLPTQSSRTADEGDNTFYSASTGITPLIPRHRQSMSSASGSKNDVRNEEAVNWCESRTESVECEVPVKVLAGSTAFLVRPSVYTI
ncbi:hypothetical protein I307_06022 [Cryptococcus deuterogattii 99/473]|uniref:Unplaced genomic scaffold supercont1.12, whole genome shotgun sequence n=1 Tax=Cryptococcus deuterogattii Ram5 TaxID=1296110 RepID=A0A0D0UYT2_9TREE|nr:hypothetical protein I309_05713 [Cryptococcus deuterogattii LA55]KIR39354.1 hypothetical protein I313_04955 [Cryptococcus deuterogattii Ram5]KIR94777.1 hypothetical protein I304_01096 [Cryptococcus deuterogattii CBS 10090]KIY54643.1 hypothetical protein I307_06022 [Cryptococcus deuterogattii 99/473]